MLGFPRSLPRHDFPGRSPLPAPGPRPFRSADARWSLSASLPSCSPRNEFVRLLGHEIRNHLAPIQNALHVLRLRGRTDPALSPVLDIIERQVSGITRTLDTISEAERASRGDVPLVRAPFAVEPWLREVVASIRDAAPEAGRCPDPRSR